MAQIITPPSEILRKVCMPVKALDKRVMDILVDMINTIKKTKDPQGVGLAAPQIGVPLRIFLARPDPDGEINIFINPEIIKSSQRMQPVGKKGVYEGCLSIPGHYAPVKRSMSVTVRYQTVELLNAQRSMHFVQKTFTGFSAHVIQHEMDHLNGILFIDRVLAQGSKLYRVVGKEWEEVGI